MLGCYMITHGRHAVSQYKKGVCKFCQADSENAMQFETKQDAENKLAQIRSSKKYKLKRWKATYREVKNKNQMKTDNLPAKDQYVIGNGNVFAVQRKNNRIGFSRKKDDLLVYQSYAEAEKVLTSYQTEHPDGKGYHVMLYGQPDCKSVNSEKERAENQGLKEINYMDKKSKEHDKNSEQCDCACISAHTKPCDDADRIIGQFINEIKNCQLAAENGLHYTEQMRNDIYHAYENIIFSENDKRYRILGDELQKTLQMRRRCKDTLYKISRIKKEIESIECAVSSFSDMENRIYHPRVAHDLFYSIFDEDTWLNVCRENDKPEKAHNQDHNQDHNHLQ